jgi:hypothetical protein
LAGQVAECYIKRATFPKIILNRALLLILCDGGELYNFIAVRRIFDFNWTAADFAILDVSLVWGGTVK